MEKDQKRLLTEGDERYNIFGLLTITAGYILKKSSNKGCRSMRIRDEHIIYTDDQIENLVIFLIEDDDPDGPHLAHNPETGELAAFVRRSSAREDEKTIRQDLEVLRFDWLNVLGYNDKELGFD